MGPSYAAALKTFSSADVALIEQTVLNWALSDGLARRIVRNLRELEFFLPTPNTIALLQSILGCHSKTSNELRREYLITCYKNVRQGGTVGNPQPLLVGRAVDKDGFVQALWQTHGTIGKGTGNFARLPEVEDFVSRLLAGDPLSPMERKLVMSPYSAWVTWNPSDSSSDPFRFAASATVVRACVGLESLVTKKGEPLLLLAYEKISALDLRRPTVADAGLHSYFEPPPPDSTHGFTVPWPEDFTPGFRPYSLPEAVHAPVAFSLLTGPPRQMI